MLSRTEVRPDAKHAKLIAEIAALRKQQLESTENATYLGWTIETRAAHENRADLLERLCLQLTALDTAA
jgi:hypothetical protein